MTQITFLTVDEAARIARCHRDLIYRAVMRGELPAARIGSPANRRRRIRIQEKDLLRLMGVGTHLPTE